MTRTDVMGGLAATALLTAGAIPTSTVDHSPVLCPFRSVTGLPCPLCGMTRSFVHTMHADIGGAVDFHPGGPILVVVLLAVIGLSVAQRLRPPHPPPVLDEFLSRAVRPALVALAVFGVVRLGVEAVAL